MSSRRNARLECWFCRRYNRSTRTRVQSSMAVYWNHWRRPRTTTFTSTWDGIAGALLFEELQLFRAAPPGLHQVRHTDVAEDALNRLRRHTDLMHACQPDLRAVGAKFVLEPRLCDQRDDILANPARAPRGVLRHQPLDARALPVAPPLANGHSR
jgi:hypothetical protein